jgi:8-oxo-dGTP pyrophosphatase MutT (NUDIX family)
MGMPKVDPRLNAIIDGLYRVSIKAIIIQDHQLLMTLEPEGWYSLPGGGAIHGATVEETVKRELEEELGLPPETVAVRPQIVTANIGVVMQGIPRANLYYRVQLTDISKIRQAELNYKWVTADMLGELAMSPATAGMRELLQELIQA